MYFSKENFTWLKQLKLILNFVDKTVAYSWYFLSDSFRLLSLIFNTSLSFFLYLIFLYLYLKLVSAIFHNIWKNNVLLGYFERNTLKRNLTYGCFIFPFFHEHIFSPELPCFEKITVRVIETMLATLLLVQMNKTPREKNQ